MLPMTPKEDGECSTVGHAAAAAETEAAKRPASAEDTKKIWSADLFSGLGLHGWWSQSFAQPVIYCEIDPLVRPLLLSAMHRGLVPKAPVHKDILDLELPWGVSSLLRHGHVRETASAGSAKAWRRSDRPSS